MTPRLPTTTELCLNPELAALYALEAALLSAELALQASHPQLELSDGHPDEPLYESKVALADAVLTHISGLSAALARYRALLRYRNTGSAGASDLDF